jgi:hypothetical protein
MQGEKQKIDQDRRQEKLPEEPFCQSCGMPMGSPDCFGTNVDNGKSNDYCCHCFQNGEFVDSKMTMEEMIDLSACIMAEKTKISETNAKEVCWSFIPKLKRWNKIVEQIQHT